MTESQQIRINASQVLEVKPEALWVQEAPAAEPPRSRQSLAVIIVRTQEGDVLYRRHAYADRIRIGRDPDLNEIVLPHQSVSQIHAHVDISSEDLTIRDCGSMNGIYVGDERVTQVRNVRFGEPIEIGPFTLEVVHPSEAAPAVRTLRMHLFRRE